MVRLSAALTGLLILLAGAVAHAAPITIVAVGASNTSGWGVADGRAYPEQLQVLLRAKGSTRA